jgi:tRNA(Ile)-lysidine synthase
VALLHMLRSTPYQLTVGHVDHLLRKGSGKDAVFVQQLARQWDLPCMIKRVNVKARARAHRMGLEEAARDARYELLASMAKKGHCSAIITAHTADDQAETILMNFLRGAGSSGLSGMPDSRDLNHDSGLVLVRPFLGVRKEQILRYLQRHSLPFRRDPSNRSLHFMRNRIRHTALPYLEKLNPGVSERLTSAADIFREEEKFWNAQVVRESKRTVRRKGQRFTVVLPRLLGYHKALSRRILRHFLPGLSFQDIEQVLQLAQSPEEEGWLELPGSWRVQRKKKALVVFQKRIG